MCVPAEGVPMEGIPGPMSNERHINYSREVLP